MTYAFGSGGFLDCSFVHIFVTDVVVTDVDAAALLLFFVVNTRILCTILAKRRKRLMAINSA